MKHFVSTVFAILVSQVIIYLVCRFTKTTIAGIEMLVAKDMIKKEKESEKTPSNLETPQAIKKMIAKLELIVARKRMGA